MRIMMKLNNALHAILNLMMELKMEKNAAEEVAAQLVEKDAAQPDHRNVE